MLTISEWRLLLSKANSMYAPIDIIADWEGQVADLTSELDEMTKMRDLWHEQYIDLVDRTSGRGPVDCL